MATLARPPLQQGPQSKRPIAPAEQSARARWLLDLLPPPGQSTIASAPWRKSQVFDLGLNRPLTLGLNPNAVVLQSTDSAPRRKPQLSLDSYTNLLTTTLAAQAPLALPLNAGRLVDSAPPREKWIGDPESSQGLIVYNGPEAAILFNTDSATPRKKAAYAWDYPNLTVTTLAPLAPLALPLSASQVVDSAPRRKLVIYELSMSRPLTLGINPNATPAQLIDSAPPRKRPAYGWDYPNLSATTLAPAAVTIPLPLSATRLDYSLKARKFQPPVDIYPNLQTTLQYVAPIYEIVPYLIGQTETSARFMLTQVYLVPNVVGSGGTVQAQSLDLGTLVTRGTIVTITMGGPENNGRRRRSRGQPPYNSGIA